MVGRDGHGDGSPKALLLRRRQRREVPRAALQWGLPLLHGERWGTPSSSSSSSSSSSTSSSYASLPPELLPLLLPHSRFSTMEDGGSRRRSTSAESAMTLDSPASPDPPCLFSSTVVAAARGGAGKAETSRDGELRSLPSRPFSLHSPLRSLTRVEP